MAEMKNDHEKMGSDQNKGSGSDTMSAAKISAGTSMGNVGESPMPHAQSGQGSQGGSQGGMGVTGASGGHSAQSSPSASSESGSGQGQSGGMADSMKQAASQMQEKAGEAYEQASEWARDAMGHRSMRSMEGARQSVQNYVAQNPVMVGLVGLAAGLLLGALLPRTRREDETFGEWADEIRQQGMHYAQEMTQRGRDYVEQTFSGDDDRFSRHESEFGSGPTGPGPGAASRGQGANRH